MSPIFCLLLGLFSLYWVALSSLTERACLTVSYFVLFDCPLLEDCSFLKSKWKENGSGGKERWGGHRRVGGRGKLVGMYCMRRETTQP